MDEGREAGIIFNKTIDVIFHRILASKLGWYCPQGRTTRQVKNWLGCQAVWEVVNGSHSACGLLTWISPGCIQGPTLSNVFTNEQEKEIKHTLIKFSNLVKSEMVANTVEGRAALESRNLTFRKAKCRVLFLKRTNLRDGTGWTLMG